MKKHAVLFVLMFSISAFAPSAFAQNKQTEIKGHYVGESVVDFVAKEPAAKETLDNCQREQQSPKSRWYKKHAADCQATASVLAGSGRGTLGGNPRWTIDSGKLVKAEMDSMYSNMPLDEILRLSRTGPRGLPYERPDALLQDLIEKLGQPNAENDTVFTLGVGFEAYPARAYQWSFPTVYWRLICTGKFEAEIPGHDYGEWAIVAETPWEYQQELAAERATHGALEK